MDPKTVEHVARLARIALAEEERAALAAELGRILAFVEQMNAVDTSGVEPMAHPHDAVQRLREDVVTETDQRERFLALAPLAEDGLYLVPKVIE
ncbi:MAG: hypothetical protein KatS3mg121_1023 [Gammaproteobacteria bacterium]|nr:MAG: hypothetical protein KatS3mg121_1023 [Gammaproteobacteria bacterium]